MCMRSRCMRACVRAGGRAGGQLVVREDKDNISQLVGYPPEFPGSSAIHTHTYIRNTGGASRDNSNTCMYLPGGGRSRTADDLAGQCSHCPGAGGGEGRVRACHVQARGVACVSA